MKVEYSKSASSTPAYALIAEGWNELVQDGYTAAGVGVPPIDPTAEVLYATSNDGDVVGVIVWATRPIERIYDVQIAYVEPSSRRKGTFAQLMLNLGQKAKVEGISEIQINVACPNTVARTVFERMRGEAVQTKYAFAI